MQRMIGFGVMIVCLIFALAGCAPSATETSNPTTLPTKTQEPIVTVPVDVTERAVKTVTPVVIPVTVPIMEVGSVYRYVDGSGLVAVPESEFTMGGVGHDNPEHLVTISDFWISSTKVTNQQYALCVNLGQCTPPDLKDNPNYEEIEHANHPVVGVTYNQASAYCSFVHARLPTEAEWEKAARGPDGNIYPWGDAQPVCDLANYSPCNANSTAVTAHDQGASYYGALEMTGNVFEWVADWYSRNYYQDSLSENPAGPEAGYKRSIRSSGFQTSINDLELFNRFSDDPAAHRSDLGFRCVVEDPDYFASFCEVPATYTQGNASESCPNIAINQFPGCTQKLSTTNVGFEGPDNALIESGGCAPTGDPRVFTCTGAGQVSISSACKVDISGDPACESGYSLAGSVCGANQTAGACLPGMDYDSEKGCCATTSSDASVSMPAICPVGTFYVAGQNYCAPSPLHGIVSVVQPITFKSCGGAPVPGNPVAGGEGGVNSCEQPSPNYCMSVQGISAHWSVRCCGCAYNDDLDGDGDGERCAGVP